MTTKVGFFGNGAVIEALKSWPGCWYGGALPERGFWGANVTSDEQTQVVSKAREVMNSLRA